MEPYKAKHLLMAAAVGAFIIFTLLALIPARVNIEPLELQADSVLPPGVTKFQDGAIHCYVYKDSQVDWTVAGAVGGISCVIAR